MTTPAGLVVKSDIKVVGVDTSIAAIEFNPETGNFKLEGYDSKSRIDTMIELLESLK